MKVLQICSYLYPALAYGGPAKVVFELSKQLSKKHIVTIFTTDVWDESRRISSAEKLQNFRQLKVVYFPNIFNTLAYTMRFFSGFGMIPAFLRQSKNFEVIHIHDVYIIPQLCIAVLANIFGKPYVITTHGVLDPVRLKKKSAIKQLLWPLAKFTLQHARVVIAVSENEAKILRSLGINSVYMVSNGIADVRVQPSAKFKKYASKKLITLLYVGKIHPQKGLKNLLLALEKSPESKYQLLIAGPDDGQLNELLQITQKLNLANVHFLGFVNERQKQELFSLSNLFVYPSYAEGFSISILEAMQAGLPVLITQACNFQTVEENKAGYVVSNKNLTHQIKMVLRSTQLTKAQLNFKGQKARRLQQQAYTVDHVAKLHEKLYMTINPSTSDQDQLEEFHKLIFRHPNILKKYLAFVRFNQMKKQKQSSFYQYLHPIQMFTFVAFVSVEVCFSFFYKLKAKYLL